MEIMRSNSNKDGEYENLSISIGVEVLQSPPLCQTKSGIMQDQESQGTANSHCISWFLLF